MLFIRKFFAWVVLAFVVVSANAQGPKDEAEWLHEGLWWDERDKEFIFKHFTLEPWHQAAVNFYSRWQDDIDDLPYADLSANALVHLFQQYSVANLLDREPMTLPLFLESYCNEPMPELEWSTHSQQFESMLIFVNAVNFRESMRNMDWVFTSRNNEAYQISTDVCMNKKWVEKQLQQIRSVQLPVHLGSWRGVALLSAGVFLEEEETYEAGKNLFIQLVNEQFDKNGMPGQKLSLKQHLQLVSGLMLMAEINQRHEDWFWGLDMHHYADGSLNLNKICQGLYNRIDDESAFEQIHHWGWLELAYRMYGGDEWRIHLDQIRSVFDRWAGGPVTLMHGRYYPPGTPDFGTAPDGFQWLYNKENLKGWQVSSRWYEIDENDFYVEDGIVYTRGARDHYLYTDRMYDRFHFKVEYKISEGSNSGVFVWAPVPGRASRTGFEIQLLDDADKKPQDNGSGSLYKVASPRVNAQIPAGQWGEIEIICNDPYITVIMNGQELHQVNLDEHPETRGRRRNGFIGLQDHAHKVQFRNMRIKLLDDHE